MAQTRNSSVVARSALRNASNDENVGVFRTKKQLAHELKSTKQQPGRATLRNRTNDVAADEDKTMKPPVARRPLTRGLVKSQSSTSTTNLQAPAGVSRMADKENVAPIVEDVHMQSVERPVTRHMSTTSVTTEAGNPLLTDPFLCPQYIDDIYEYLREIEGKLNITRNYLAVHKASLKGDAITHRMRAITVDWLMQIAIRYHLGNEAMCLSVQLLDRFLTNTLVPKSQLQLAAVTSLMIACKYEEVSCPTLDDYAYLTANSVTTAEILEFERAILRQLDFNLGLPLSMYFVRRFSFLTMASPETHTTSKFLMEAMLTDYVMCHLKPSEQAAACVWIARYATIQANKERGKTQNIEAWPQVLVNASGMTTLRASGYARQLAAHAIKLLTPGCKMTAAVAKINSSTTKHLNLATIPLLETIVNDCLLPH